jgi:transcriptional regulatory protein LEU3
MLTTLDDFYLTCVRLHILSFHLFAPKSSINNDRLTALYEIACHLVEVTMDLDTIQKFAEFGPVLLSKFSNLAAFMILKIGRSHIRDTLDLTRGQTSYFSVIQIHKKMSVQSDDIYARASLINTQLWTSNEIFKLSDGVVDSLILRCRSRLGMSSVYDCYWWWRQEFGGQSNPYEGINGRCSACLVNVTDNLRSSRRGQRWDCSVS